MLKWFPLLIIAVIAYNALALTMPPDQVQPMLGRFIPIAVFSGDVWHFTTGDFLVLVALILLFTEVVKSTGTGAVQVLNHGLSMLTFVVALIEFLVVPGFATSTFFFIVMMCFFDVVAGFTVSIVAAKRDLGTAHGIIGTN